MTQAQALPFHLCLRLGIIHPDYLLSELTAGQWADWEWFDRDVDLAIHREDLLWAECRADFLNANRSSSSDPSYSPANLMHHFDTDLLWADDLTVQDIVGGVVGLVLPGQQQMDAYAGE